MRNMEEENIKPDDDTLRVEYTVAQEDYIHNDSLPWQIGAILIVGIFISWSFLLEEQVEIKLFIIVSSLSTILMTIWFMFAHHYRQTYLCKLNRMKEIERCLGMELHSRWDDKMPCEQRSYYHTFGPRGIHMITMIYCLMCLGGPVIGLFKFDVKLRLFMLFVILFIIIAVTHYVYYNERRIKQLLNKRSKATSANMN